MDTKSLEKFCPWARVRLIEAVDLRCHRFGLDEKGRAAAPAGSDVVAGRVLTAAEKVQRDALIARVEACGYDAFVQNAAYSWFNRFAAIRFMELHGYLRSGVRMLSSAVDGSFSPDCLRQAADLDLPGLDVDEALRLMAESDDEALFRLVLVAQCNELAECLPEVFGHVGEADALLLPDNLLRQGEGDVLYHLVADVPEDAWADVEVLGWMYQFYNSEVKDEFFKAKRKAAAADIAPATQLFTPEWIVRYMVENSLGRLWMLNHPESGLREHMEYYIEPDAEHEDFLRVASPEDITACDPACGSGHILSYAFELLFYMYEEAGYREREIPELILTKNLSGMEIDERAAQIASLVLALRAREHDRRFFGRGVHANVCVLESIPFEESELTRCGKGLPEALAHLGEVGSLLAPTESDLANLRAELATCEGDLFANAKAEKIKLAIQKCEQLARRFDVVVANPPYMGSSSFNPFMSAWVKKHCPETKSDLCTCFIERGYALAKERGYSAMVTMQSWMFLGSFEKMRERLLAEKGIVTMAHLGPRAFDAIGGEVVSVTADVLYNAAFAGRGAYFRLVDINGSEPKRQALLEAIKNPDCGYFYRADASTFHTIPGSPIAYWMPQELIAAFAEGRSIDDDSDYTGSPNITGDNDRYLRFYWEVSKSEVNQKWRHYSKGGEFRRWFGNIIHVVDWSDVATAFYADNKTSTLLPKRYWFEGGITYTMLTSGRACFRHINDGCIWDKSGPVICRLDDREYLWLAFLNSSTAQICLDAVNPTMNLQVKDVKALPLLQACYEAQCDSLVARCIDASKTDWDSFETSWDFKRHPLL